MLKRLLVHCSVSQLEVAILGLAQLRERGQIEWLRPGEKVTSRALYHTRSGVSQMFALATNAYWQVAKQRPKRRAASSLGEILMHTMRQSAEYRAYIKSPAWRARREQMLAKAGMRCQRCGRYGHGIDVHHVRYDNLGREPESDLEVLCPDCDSIADQERVRETWAGPAA